MNITFLYPSKNIGGAQLLFVRLAQYLSAFENVKVAVVDYNDGFLKQALATSENIEILPFVNNKVLIDFETVIITPLSNITACETFLQMSNAKVSFFFWAIHPDNLHHALYEKGRRFFLWRKKKIRRIIKECSNKRKIFYMDRTNYQSAQKEVKGSFTPLYIPIPVPVPATYKKEQQVRNQEILNIGWLGRISTEKVFSIINIIEQIKRVSKTTHKHFRFHIIGNGEKLSMLLRYLETSGIEFIHQEPLVDKQLDEYIVQHIDLGVAMGTSALEFAIRHVPVVLLDYSYNKFPDNTKYHWLFETLGYSLGSEVTLHQHERNHTFEQIIQQCETQYDIIADQCFNYVKSHHDIEVVAKQLFNLFSNVEESANLEGAIHYINTVANTGLYLRSYRFFQKVKKYMRLGE